MWFYYDANGKRVGFSTYDGTPYYYIYNAMGDVIGMYNYYADVIYYHYDSWGKLISMTNASGAEIQYGSAQWKVGYENPFRYRGYMYDNITQLYYLNSRYYDPETGRFLNADGIINNSQGPLGTNLYTYCLNDPLNRIDSEGQFSKFIDSQRADDKIAYMGTIMTLQNIPWGCWGNMADNGCGVIALYNVFTASGHYRDFTQVATLLEDAYGGALMGGLCGVRPGAITDYVRDVFIIADHGWYSSEWRLKGHFYEEIILLIRNESTPFGGYHYVAGVVELTPGSGYLGGQFHWYNSGVVNFNDILSIGQFEDRLKQQSGGAIQQIWGLKCARR